MQPARPLPPRPGFLEPGRFVTVAAEHEVYEHVPRQMLLQQSPGMSTSHSSPARLQQLVGLLPTCRQIPLQHASSRAGLHVGRVGFTPVGMHVHVLPMHFGATRLGHWASVQQIPVTHF